MENIKYSVIWGLKSNLFLFLPHLVLRFSRPKWILLGYFTRCVTNTLAYWSKINIDFSSLNNDPISAIKATKGGVIWQLAACITSLPFFSSLYPTQFVRLFVCLIRFASLSSLGCLVRFRLSSYFCLRFTGNRFAQNEAKYDWPDYIK